MALFGDLEDHAFGVVDELVRRAAFVFVGTGGNFATDADQLPQQRALAHDVGIRADVVGRGRVARKAREIREPAGFFFLALADQVLGERDGVARLTPRGKLGDGLENDLVVATVEVVGQQAVGDGVPGAVVEQQAAEHGLLGLERVRRNAQAGRLQSRGRARLAARPAVARPALAAPPSRAPWDERSRAGAGSSLRP